MEKEHFDGEFTALGLLIGICIGLVKDNLVFGFVIGIVIGIALDWLGNLILLWRRQK